MEKKDKIKINEEAKENIKTNKSTTFGEKIIALLGNLLALIPMLIGIVIMYGIYKLIFDQRLDNKI